MLVLMALLCHTCPSPSCPSTHTSPSIVVRTRHCLSWRQSKGASSVIIRRLKKTILTKSIEA